MDWSDPLSVEVFFSVYEYLPRQGPGSKASTAKALSFIRSLPPQPQILDLGCGTGSQTLDLADLLPQAEITALDNHAPFVQLLQAQIQNQNLAHRIQAQKGDMGNLNFPSPSFDLIWCEGAAYFLGIENALKSWYSLLQNHGYLAFTEAVLLSQNPPQEVHDFWVQEYPQIGTVDSIQKLFKAHNYQLLGDFILADKDWWQFFYTPMRTRIQFLKEVTYATNTKAQSVLTEMEKEILVHQKFSSYYGYCFFILQKN